ncbi:hypothetical protein GQ44DRAFT_699095 [Phaeosphaeriaceae sp. PMI808]|nr:hypothetical protein GQ44DRAFT_699095 [Phaeosphaeriaceae sp. PMI808]
MASLLTIPLELLVSVSTFLPTPDLGALRLTCKQIEKSLYEWFSQEFFSKKQFMLTFKSLQALVDISKHVSFSKKLTHVIIATNAYDTPYHYFRDAEAAARYIQGGEDQKSLLVTGAGREMLTEAFQNLQNLQTVGIRDFNSNQRLRDGISWSSWGATTVQNETGHPIQYSSHPSFVPQMGASFTSSVFQILLYALGKSNQTPHTIEALLRHNALSSNAFNIPEHVQPTLEPLLRSLKTLLLNITSDHSDFQQAYTSSVPPQLPTCRSLCRFLHLTSQLTHLRLNFQVHDSVDNERFIKWLSHSKSPSVSQIADFYEPPAVDFAHLTTFDFGQVMVSPTTLLDIIQKLAPTLQNLSLWKVALNGGRANVVWDLKPNLWAHFFRALGKLPRLQLRHLKAGMLKQGGTYVNFKRPGDDDAPMLKVKEGEGKNTEALLKEFEEEVFVLWPPDVVKVDEDMADNDEDDDSDDYQEDDEEDDDEDDDDEDSEGDEG